MSIIFTLSVLFIIQITLFHFYRVSALVTGAIFAMIFGELSLGIINYEAISNYLVDGVIFMILFYLGLTKPNGEFFKKYIWQYKKSLLAPTLITVASLFSIGLFLEFSIDVALLIVLALSVLSLSTNSIVLNHLKELELQKSEISKIFFAKALPNNMIVIVMFITLLACFSNQCETFSDSVTPFVQVLGFIAISFAISRYVYPRVSQQFKNINIHLVLLLINAGFQSYIATLLGLHFAIGVFLSTILIPELFLKMKTLEPIRDRVATLNNYTAVPLFGLIIGLNIDIGVIFNYELWIPFGILSITLFLIQYLSSFLSLIMLPLNSQEREIVIFGSFAKSELAMVTLLIALSYGVIGGDIFTLAIITMSIFNVIAWHKLKSANMEKN